MAIKEKQVFDDSSLQKIALDAWKRNKAVHLMSKGGMRAWLCRDINTPLLAVFPDQRQVRDFIGDAESLGLFDRRDILPELSFAEDDVRVEALKVQRGYVLECFKKHGGVMAATPASLLAPFASGGDSFRFKTGEAISRDGLVSWLDRKGYERSDLVWSPGQYIFRGSIVDIFNPTDSFPIRLEFFDDYIESIRVFQPETQKSLERVDEAVIRGLTARSESELANFLPNGLRILYFDPKELDTTAENATWLWSNLEKDKQDQIQWQKWEELYNHLSLYPRLRVTQDINSSNIRLPLNQLPLFKGRLRNVEIYCSQLVGQGYSIEVYSETPGNIAWAQGMGYRAVNGILTSGFIDGGSKIVVFSDLELVGATIPRRTNEHRAPSDWGVGLIQGQWVVHDEYGVARYLGPETVKTLDGDQEYLSLQFADDRRLLIPVMQFFKISPWSPVPGQEPTADSLKSSNWKKASEKAKLNAEKAAKELLSVYAERELTRGYAFAPSEGLMKELEDSFPFAETKDQLEAIERVEEDMESSVPMDRLIVGDVGFGKTEVAIRAAGKAAFSGKQVAIMAPTTLLAQQHYETFSSRFGALPIRVEVLSRFVPINFQKKILKDLGDGKVDILIGTHRLLAADVKFKDLGLVIIDEEHRFGVMHKEHLKKMAPGVDVLMLSATPIPRSLSLSMSGIRDFSVLQTPPQRRLPVITVVRPWSEELLKNAVIREKNRGGQVFFVHNRIHDIQEKAVMLGRLFPKLKMGIAHSRMPEGQLEKTMTEFSMGRLDILICTTIVESGLDIPMANTLIVDDSHELGLAQMYQLRGRVGRREDQAYAFLFYPNDAPLTAEGSERLEAIAQLDELGAGYLLAQRDLQIRGGGDLIGVSQHGNVNRVGYQKYFDLLAEEIAKIQGRSRRHVDLEIAFPATIPKDYLPQENLRVTLYRRLLKADSPSDAASLAEETRDRFGKLPNSLRFLFNTSLLKTAAPDLDITRILCSQYETILEGIPEGEWSKLKLPPRWFRRINGLVGPGGFAGIETISGIIQEKIGVNLLK